MRYFFLNIKDVRESHGLKIKSALNDSLLDLYKESRNLSKFGDVR
jgi:hypothetical protein